MIAAAVALSTAWMLSYEGRSTNELVRDARLPILVQTRVPAKLSRQMFEGLGGPPDPVIVRGNRYISMSACVAHACPSKGFFWVDTRTGIGLGALVDMWNFKPQALQLGSNAFAANAIPVGARKAVVEWLSDIDAAPQTATFTDRAGRSTDLDPKAFTPPAKFRPPPSGPSFACEHAMTPIEKAICADDRLSKADLALATLYDRMRRAYDTVADRVSLAYVQREWLRSRDADCADRPDAAECLLKKYEEQRDLLYHWTPR